MPPLRSHLPPLHISLRALLLAALASLATAAAGAATPAAPALHSDTETATAGFYRLEWQTDAGPVELQESPDPDFRSPTTLYRGSDRATVISGKPDGTRFYRVRASGNTQPGPWSEAVAVTVEHHSLARAALFLSLGILVFLAIVFVIVRGTGDTE